MDAITGGRQRHGRQRAGLARGALRALPGEHADLAAHGVAVASGLGPDILIAPGVLFDDPD